MYGTLTRFWSTVFVTSAIQYELTSLIILRHCEYCLACVVAKWIVHSAFSAVVAGSNPSGCG